MKTMNDLNLSIVSFTFQYNKIVGFPLRNLPSSLNLNIHFERNLFDFNVLEHKIISSLCGRDDLAS